MRSVREREPSLIPGLHANASHAGQCARKIGFQIAGLAPTDPPDGNSLVNFAIGDAIHNLVQTAMFNHTFAVEDEVKGTVEDFITVRADLTYPAEDGLVCCEIKSISDFAFEKATGAALKSNGRWKKKEPDPPAGPNVEHILQCGISAKAFDATYLAIVYVRKTAAKDEPVLWEWRYTAAEHQDAIQGEIARLRAIVDLLKADTLPDREYQGEIIESPSRVKFPCGYCSHREACLEAGPGELKI